MKHRKPPDNCHGKFLFTWRVLGMDVTINNFVICGMERYDVKKNQEKPEIFDKKF